ncbi:MAG: hypothetical protein H6888_14935 [Nitratireductor sp.]|nr:hypothetical protein [Nitratireductor sp.]MCC0022358.1 hypothetical protein [Nitratireductor sp.]
MDPMISKLGAVSVISTFLLGALVATGSETALADGYVKNHGPTMSKVRSMKSKGMYPVSMSCGADTTSKVFKPVVDMEWQKNDRDVDWAAYAYTGQLEWKPSPPGAWRKVYGKVQLAGRGGSKFYCALYHKR